MSLSCGLSQKGEEATFQMRWEKAAPSGADRCR
jgi:hypothetical protein